MRHRSDRRGFLLAGALPPPTHGMAGVNAKVAQILDERDLLLCTCDVGPGSSRRPLNYLVRMLRMLKALLVVGGVCGPHAGLYIGLDGGIGVYFFALLACVARWRRAPIIIHHHSYAYLDRRAKAVGLLVKLAGLRQMHVCLCEDMRRCFLSTYANDLPAKSETFVLSNAAMIDLGDPVPKTSDITGLVLGHMSNLCVEKGSDLFLDLAVEMLKLGTIHRVELAGPVSERSLALRIDQVASQFPGRVRYRGRVAPAAKAEFFADIDIFVFPTKYRHEAQPLVLMEALSYGRPILAIDRGCISCDFGHSEGAIIGRDDDFVASARQWILELAQDPIAMAACRHAARVRWLEMREQADRQATFLFDGVFKDAIGGDDMEGSWKTNHLAGA